MPTRPGLRTLTFTGALNGTERETLREQLGVVFCDEAEPRPGWGWLAPDRRLTVTEGDGHWRLHIWETADMGTTDEWVDTQIREAFHKTGLQLVPEPPPVTPPDQ